MSQVTGPLSIDNGAATPVAKSFAPTAVAPDRSLFTERTAGSSAGFLKLEVLSSFANGSRSTNRIDLNFDLPVIEVVDGVSKVTRVGRFKGYFVIPDTMLEAERSDLLAFVANSLDNAQIKAVIRDLDPLY
jgi:hypothetical protein